MCNKQVFYFTIIKYRKTIFPTIWLFELLFLSDLILKEVNPIITTFIGLLFSLPVSMFWFEYKNPVLKIENWKPITLSSGFIGPDRICNKICNVIFVENVGRSAAKKCKAYIVTNGNKVRLGGSIPSERPNATINVNDNEGLDFFFFYTGGNKFYFSTENGLETTRESDPITDCKILITSENADPVEIKVKINSNWGIEIT
jgi:hypothetical protein